MYSVCSLALFLYDFKTENTLQLSNYTLFFIQSDEQSVCEKAFIFTIYIQIQYTNLQYICKKAFIITFHWILCKDKWLWCENQYLMYLLYWSEHLILKYFALKTISKRFFFLHHHVNSILLHSFWNFPPIQQLSYTIWTWKGIKERQ